MPPLFAANGHAFSAFLTDRFSINDIIGKTVVIHDSPDDFSTQPSGNSGSKLACGQIIGKKI
jgi:Cu-Zn family superoxide dismutase